MFCASAPTSWHRIASRSARGASSPSSHKRLLIQTDPKVRGGRWVPPLLGRHGGPEITLWRGLRFRRKTEVLRSRRGSDHINGWGKPTRVADTDPQCASCPVAPPPGVASSARNGKYSQASS